VGRRVTGEGQRGVVFGTGMERLVGRLFLARADGPRPTVLVLHGVPGIEQNFDLAHAVRDSGRHALVFSYRGCWGSAGNFTIRGMLDDIRRVVDELTRGRYPQVDATRLGVFGHSLGGWAAFLTAYADPRLRWVGAYGMIPDLRGYEDSEADLDEHCVPWVRGVTASGYAEQYRALGDEHSPLERVRELAGRPALLVHGGRDAGVPLSHVQVLQLRAGDDVRLVVHPEADHDFTWHRAWLAGVVVDWLGTVEPVGSAALGG
jgi:uncharacterized protein